MSNPTKTNLEVQKLVKLYGETKVKLVFEIGARLREIRNGKLYKQLDEKAYPTFSRYLESVDIPYAFGTELISLYEAYILAAGLKIEDLCDISYHRIRMLKPVLFEKKDGEYVMSKSKSEIVKWLNDASSDLSVADLRQHVIEERVGEHEHEFTTYQYKVCKVCGLKEIT